MSRRRINVQLVLATSFLILLFANRGTAISDAEQQDIINRLKSEQKCYIQAQGNSEWLKQSEHYFEYDERGRLISVTLATPNVGDENLKLISGIASLTNVVLVCHSTTDRLTPSGISSLKALPNLESLRMQCFGQLQPGVFKEICNLHSLRRLQDIACQPAGDEFDAITNLTNLAAIHVSYCFNFGNRELNLLASLPMLRVLNLSWDGVTSSGTNILNHMNLTNTLIRLSKH